MMFGKKNSFESGEAELEQVLRNFRESVQAWSEAEYARPRSVVTATVHHTWKWALTWALGCVFAVGGLGVGLYEHHQQQQAAQGNGAQQMQKQAAGASAAPSAGLTMKAPAAEAPVQQIAEVDASEPDANLLAAVDSDVSRQVPSAMEPLAQLMEGSLSQ